MLEAIEKKLGKINLLYENICFPDINLTFDIYWIEATEKKTFYNFDNCWNEFKTNEYI